jgi:hypothetical protein
MITANELLQHLIVESGTKETQFVGANLVAEGYIELKMETSFIS